MKTFSEQALIGVLLSQIEFWSDQYEFSFQFWGEDNNNVYINRDGIELTAFGGRETIRQILEETLEWCEKANPSKKYPLWLKNNYSMKEDQAYKVPFEEQKQQALKDYKTISERACHWSGFIQAAIEAYQDPMKDEASMKSIYDKALANNYYSEDAAFEAMTEWAKREISKLAVEEVAIPITPRTYSEQEYWKKRCELAEKLLMSFRMNWDIDVKEEWVALKLNNPL